MTNKLLLINKYGLFTEIETLLKFSILIGL